MNHPRVRGAPHEQTVAAPGAIVDALPLEPGMRVLEIGGAPGTAARTVCERLTPGGHIRVIDRSARGVAQIERTAAAEIAAGPLSARCVAVEEFALLPDEEPFDLAFDLAFGIRVGALDGRHPTAGLAARARIRDALCPSGRLYIDGGNPLRMSPLE